MITNGVLIVLGLLGFLISLYFTLVYHKLMPSNSALIPKFCRLDESSCVKILNTRDARILGVPNFYLGLLFYALIIVFSFGVAADRLILLIVASGISVSLSIYLAYALVVKLKVFCFLCFTSHVLNALILMLLLKKL